MHESVKESCDEDQAGEASADDRVVHIGILVQDESCGASEAENREVSEPRN